MRRFWLTSCACSLVLALLAGESASGQTPLTNSSPITDTSSGQTSVQLNDGSVFYFSKINNNDTYSGQTTIAGNSTLYYSNDAQLGLSSVGSPNTINLGDTTLQGALGVIPSGLSFTSLRNLVLNTGGGLLIGPTDGNVVTYQGNISGVGRLTINGGTVALTNTGNSFTGGTLVTGNSTLQISSDAVLGAGLATSIQLGSGAVADGTAASGTLQFTNNTGLSSSRSIILGEIGGTIKTNSAAGVTLSGSILGVNTALTELNNTSLTTPANGTGSSYSLSVGGNGVLTLSGSNLFTGDLTVQKGATLAITSDQSLGGYTVVANSLTGISSYTLGATPNNLILNGGTLQLAAGTTIQHPIELNGGGGTIDTNGNTAVITSNVMQYNNSTANNNNLTVTNSSTTTTGNLVLDGMANYIGNATVQNGADLIIGDSANPKTTANGTITVTAGGAVGGSGTLAGQLINNGGTVSPANQFKVSNYVQNGGTLDPVISANTQAYSATGNNSGSAELQVLGTSTINGGTLTPTFTTTGFFRAGRYLIFAPGTMTGVFANQASINSQALLTDIPAIGLTGYVTQDPNTGNYFLVLTQLPTLPSYDRANLFPVLSSAAIDEGQQATGSLLDHLAGVRTNALADELGVALTESHRVRGTSPYGVWVMPLGNNGTVTGNQGVAGYTVQGGGLMAGIDTEWFRSVSIGMALGYTNNFVKLSDGNAGGVSMPRFAVYGGWWRGAFALDGVVGVGLGTIDATRPVAVPSLFQTAYSNHVANEKSAALQASAAFAFDGWVVGPALGAKFLNLSETGFTESGANLYNFTTAARQTSSLRPFASVTLTKRFMVSDHWALVPELKVGFEHEVINQLHDASVKTAGDDYSFLYNGLLPGSDMLRLDGGLKLETSRDAAFFIDYNHLQSSTTTNEYVSGGFRYRL